MINATIPKNIAQPDTLHKEFLASTKNTMAVVISTIIPQMRATHTATVGKYCTKISHIKPIRHAIAKLIMRISKAFMESSNKLIPVSLISFYLAV